MSEEWGNAVLQDLVTFQKGRKVDVLDYPHEGYEPYLGAGVLAGDPVENYAYPCGGIFAEPTDVLMLWDGERSGLVGTGKAGVVSSTVAKLSPSQKIDGKYLYYFLLDRFEWIQGRRTGTGVPHVPKDLGKILQVKFPRDLDTQKKIAKILSTLDEAIEQTEALIEKTKKIKAGLMQDLFTRGVLPNGQLRPPRDQAPNLYKDSPLGWIPGEWEVIELGKLAEIVSGVTLGGNRPANGVEIPYLRVANVQDGYLDLSEVKTIRATPEQITKLALRKGDVLMNEGGDFDKLGRGTVWNEEITPCIHQNHVFRVRPRTDKLLSDYLAYWTQSEFGKRYFVLNSKQSTNLASINSTQLHKFPVAVPDTYEQTHIQTIMKTVDDKSSDLGVESLKLAKQKSGLMHDLLSENKGEPSQNPPVDRPVQCAERSE